MARHHKGRHHYFRRRHNPDYTGAAVKALWGVGGGVVTATVPGMLGVKSGGAIGYVAAGATALGAGYLGHKFFGTEAGDGILTGGLIAVAGMIIADFTGKKLVSFSPLRGYGPLSYPLPSSTPGISYQLPASGAVTSPVPVKTVNGMGVYRGRSKFAA